MMLHHVFDWKSAPDPWPEIGPEISAVLKAVAREPLDYKSIPQPQNISMASIRQFVCSHYGVTEIDLLSSRQSAAAILARHVAIALCARMTECSLSQIARSFHRDHATIRYAIKKCHAGLPFTIEDLERKILDGRA